MGECPGGNGNDSDGWGHPACTNRDPAPKQRVSAVRVQPVLYKLTIKVVTVSGEEFDFPFEAGVSEPLEDIQETAGKEAKHLCWIKGVELKSFEIVELVTANSR